MDKASCLSERLQQYDFHGLQYLMLLGFEFALMDAVISLTDRSTRNGEWHGAITQHQVSSPAIEMGKPDSL